MPDLFAGIARYHLLGFVWFDIAQHHGLFNQDWQLKSPAAIAAFRAGVRSLRGH